MASADVDVQELIEEAESITNLIELFAWRCGKDPGATALKYKRDGVWHDISYQQWFNNVLLLSDALSRHIKAGDYVSILAHNRPEWTYCDLAVMANRGIVAPIYPTNMARDVGYILNDCSAKLMMLDTIEQARKVKSLLDEKAVPHLETVVCFEPVHLDDPRFISYADFIKQGRVVRRSDFINQANMIDPHTVMTLIYTSGTTGNPKGVQLTHHNILSNMKAAVNTIGTHYFHQGCMLSFLPLSHSLERTCGYYLAIMTGVTIAYAEGIPQLIDNFREVKPTILISVPRIYEKIYAAMLENATTPLKRKIVSWAMDVARRKALHNVEGKKVGPFFEVEYALAHRLVFSKLLSRLGGRFRFAATGGAPLAKEIAIFLKGAGLMVIEGYGQTETSPILTLNGPDEMKFGSVGRPIPGVELRLEPDPEGEQGDEILARGPNIMKGYYRKEAETKATIDEQGWLRTGDIGYIDEDGFLFITDRKKELLKTSGGKFVAPAPIENKLKEQSLIEQACVIGNKRKYCVALIYPNMVALESHTGIPAAQLNLEEPTVRQLFQNIVDSVNRNLNRWEQIKSFAFLPHELTQERGELTPTLKLKRRIVDEHFKELIDSLYA